MDGRLSRFIFDQRRPAADIGPILEECPLEDEPPFLAFPQK
jgi:hypothetical protein